MAPDFNAELGQEKGSGVEHRENPHCPSYICRGDNNGRQKRGRESFCLTPVSVAGLLTACRDDSEARPGTKSTTCSIGPWGGRSLEDNVSLLRPLGADILVLFLPAPLISDHEPQAHEQSRLTPEAASDPVRSARAYLLRDARPDGKALVGSVGRDAQPVCLTRPYRSV